jgi:raffinose/stachyose/melibiose transport system permease protein
MLPLARPAILTVTLLNFMNFWNELLLAITLVTDPKMRTIQAAMMMFVGEHGSNYAIAAASLVLSMLPTLLLYLVMSDKFIEGLTAGAVKG